VLFRSWVAANGHYAHDLLPLPYTDEAIIHVADRIRLVQDHLGRRILIENVSSYLTYHHSNMKEWEFIAAIAEDSDCGILLDVNNVFVSAVNHGFDAIQYLDGIPAERVVQFHLAGHSDAGTHLVDTHDHPVCPEVWSLFREAVRRFGRVPTLIERDDNIPAFEEVMAESERARAIEAEVLNVSAIAA